MPSLRGCLEASESWSACKRRNIMSRPLFEAIAEVGGRIERADLQSRLRMPGLIYAGNHGLEISGEGILFIEPTAAGSSDRIRKLAEELGSKLQGIAGAFVENKGLTLSIH